MDRPELDLKQDDERTESVSDALLAAIGPFYDSASAMHQLGGMAPHELTSRRAALTILAMQTGSGDWLYPAWQFTGLRDVHPQLQPVLRGLGDLDGWIVGTWLINPREDLDGRSPRQALSAGADPEVIAVLAREEISLLCRRPRETARRRPRGCPLADMRTALMVMFESGQYSVPRTLLGATVWVRTHGIGEDEWVVIVHVGDDGPLEVARHRRATPGTPKIQDGHFPPRPSGPLDRQPRAKSAAESQFLDLGEGPVCGWSRPPPWARRGCGSR